MKNIIQINPPLSTSVILSEANNPRISLLPLQLFYPSLSLKSVQIGVKPLLSPGLAINLPQHNINTPNHRHHIRQQSPLAHCF